LASADFSSAALSSAALSSAALASAALASAALASADFSSAALASAALASALASPALSSALASAALVPSSALAEISSSLVVWELASEGVASPRPRIARMTRTIAARRPAKRLLVPLLISSPRLEWRTSSRRAGHHLVTPPCAAGGRLNEGGIGFQQNRAVYPPAISRCSTVKAHNSLVVATAPP
jgi:hypothetical protein